MSFALLSASNNWMEIKQGHIDRVHGEATQEQGKEVNSLPHVAATSGKTRLSWTISVTRCVPSSAANSASTTIYSGQNAQQMTSILNDFMRGINKPEIQLIHFDQD